ncbi:DUF6716 putative glycosyltransferase [Streptomyces sp. NPDC001435]|uniref:DUF6716 putative glycosyltransferase n=1 Tax=Streptomyces sp. NPDC001435 TaxID=3364576 RepID=UPI003676710D
MAEPAPANLQLVHGNMGEVLDRTDLLVTVGSTAALESTHRGIPTAILTDFGVRGWGLPCSNGVESLGKHGNHYFLHSGCLASWDDLDAGALPVPHPAWADAQGIGKTDPYAAARARVADLRAAGPLPPLRPYYTPQRAGIHLTGLLERHGFDERDRRCPVGRVRPVRGACRMPYGGSRAAVRRGCSGWGVSGWRRRCGVGSGVGHG